MTTESGNQATVPGEEVVNDSIIIGGDPTDESTNGNDSNLQKKEADTIPPHLDEGNWHENPLPDQFKIGEAPQPKLDCHITIELFDNLYKCTFSKDVSSNITRVYVSNDMLDILDYIREVFEKELAEKKEAA